MAAKLIIAVPSKGRLKKTTGALFERAGLALRKTGHERGYSARPAARQVVIVICVTAVRLLRCAPFR